MRFTAVFAVVFTTALLTMLSSPAYAAELPKQPTSTFVSSVLLSGVDSSLLIGQEEPAQTDTVAEPAAEKPVSEKAQQKPKPVIINVKKGDTLSKIATAHKTTWVRLFDANKTISDPNVINPGQKLRIPRADEKLKHRALPAVAPASTTTTPTARTAAANTTASYPVSSNAAKAFIYAHESGNNPNATNPNGCYGIGQDCNGVLRTMCGADYACQDAYFTRYAMARYGSWEGAYAFWQSHHWW